MAKGKAKSGRKSKAPVENRKSNVQQDWSIDSVPLPKRQTGETEKNYHAFCVYLKQPPHSRSLQKTTEHLGSRDRRYIEKWSSKFNWVERCKAYDRKVERAKAQAWHKHKALCDLEMLEQQRQAQQKAKKVLTTKVVDRLETHLDSCKASEVASISRELREIAKHDPEKLEPPAPVGEGGVDLRSGLAVLSALGFSRDQIKKLMAEAPVFNDNEGGED